MAKGQGRSSGQGVKLLYIRDYLRANTNKDHAKNANKICDFLATKGIEASPKTIYNDIFRLQVDFGEPIEYSAKQRGYYITKPLFEPYELRLIVDSIQSSKFITQSEARLITAKIKEFADVYTTQLPGKITLYTKGKRCREAHKEFAWLLSAGLEHGPNEKF